MKLVREAYHSWGAEVVFITSNFGGNKEIMEGCKAEGIAAFVCRCSPIPLVLTDFGITFRAPFGISEAVNYRSKVLS